METTIAVSNGSLPSLVPYDLTTLSNDTTYDSYDLPFPQNGGPKCTVQDQLRDTCHLLHTSEVVLLAIYFGAYFKTQCN